MQSQPPEDLRYLGYRLCVLDFGYFTFSGRGLKTNQTEGNVSYDHSGGGQSTEDEASNVSGSVRKDFTEKTHREKQFYQKRCVSMLKIKNKDTTLKKIDQRHLRPNEDDFPKGRNTISSRTYGGKGRLWYLWNTCKTNRFYFWPSWQVARIFIMLLFITKEDLGKESLWNTNVESVNWFNLSEKTI